MPFAGQSVNRRQKRILQYDILQYSTVHIFLMVLGQILTPNRRATPVIQRHLVRSAHRIFIAIPPSCASHSQLSKGTSYMGVCFAFDTQIAEFQYVNST